MKKLMLLIVLLVISITAKELIDLPKPAEKLGKDVLEVMVLRKSTRAYSESAISLENLSTILWSGYGINRKETGQKTVPVAFNVDCQKIYVFDNKGVWLFMPEENQLKLVL